MFCIYAFDTILTWIIVALVYINTGIIYTGYKAVVATAVVASKSIETSLSSTALVGVSWCAFVDVLTK